MEPPSEGNELVASENATGTDTVPHEENEASENLSDASDAGWDTDLEIEGMKKTFAITCTWGDWAMYMHFIDSQGFKGKANVQCDMCMKSRRALVGELLYNYV